MSITWIYQRRVDKSVPAERYYGRAPLMLFYGSTYAVACCALCCADLPGVLGRHWKCFGILRNRRNMKMTATITEKGEIY
jgi:hypothetical protein